MRANAQRPSDRMVAQARECVSGLAAAASDAWALWDELRHARYAAHERAIETVYGSAPGSEREVAHATAPPPSPEELRALGEYVRADQRVVGATRLADALAIPLSDAYDRPDESTLPLGIAPAVTRERALAAAQRRARRSGRS